MPRLINADKLAEYKAACCGPLTEWQQGWNDAIDTIIEETPTVDAVEVVRCKDCEYSNGEYKYCVNDIFAKPNGYCSYGKRKVDAEPVRYGRWIKNDNGTYSCSECHSWIPNEQHYYARYCLHCGAKMLTPLSKR